MLVGDRTSLYVLDLTGDLFVRALPAGVHVLENVAYGEPSPKVDRVHRLLDDRLGPAGGGDPFVAFTEVLGDHVVTDPSKSPAGSLGLLRPR